MFFVLDVLHTCKKIFFVQFYFNLHELTLKKIIFWPKFLKISKLLILLPYFL